MRFQVLVFTIAWASVSPAAAVDEGPVAVPSRPAAPTTSAPSPEARFNDARALGERETAPPARSRW